MEAFTMKVFEECKIEIIELTNDVITTSPTEKPDEDKEIVLPILPV